MLAPRRLDCVLFHQGARDPAIAPGHLRPGDVVIEREEDASVSLESLRHHHADPQGILDEQWLDPHRRSHVASAAQPAFTGRLPVVRFWVTRAEDRASSNRAHEQIKAGHRKVHGG